MGVVKLADYRHNPVQHQEASSMGYVSIHRQFMDSRLYKDSQAVHLWLHLILKANHESTVVNTDIGPITVDRGQMITGRPSLVRETFIPDNKVRSLLRTFESKGMLNICSMGKKFSLFTIVKYDDFQAKNCPTVVQRLSNANTSNGAALSGDCPTVVQRLSINNNINNISNTDVLESATADKKSDKKKPSVSCQDVVDAYHEILPEAPRIRALNDKRKNQIRTFWRKAGVIIPAWANDGVALKLAVQVCMDNVIQPSDALLTAADSAYQTICIALTKIPPLERRNDMPRGSGNKSAFTRNRFYIEKDDPST